MVELKVIKKTGFINIAPHEPIIIRDFRGKIFYSTEGLRIIPEFNLPIGTYYIDSGKFKLRAKPVFFKLPAMPKIERRFKSPDNFKILFANNPNKCTINWFKKTITFDESFRDKLLPELYFVLYHEFGHHLYLTEKYADLFAARRMLIKGYNPSQIVRAPITSLSAYQEKRKQHILNKIILNK